ncbi:phosphonate C-P lyase system protein PhnG [Desulfovibrio sp. X2]|uniref:phosphonate C-P lyase system protein PhnG n=1 Tax=Desulfovibrio sp. X2 TaxID=941449 RepID=UPI000358962E|nr:phosphonate C-P lyase system protein PhnG [Desulfovibrio sp. X2]EPR43824.1 phosphonate C-P lyase system protein PhnG [Desulfovibrio sp. X2]
MREANAARREWMGLFARAPREELETAARELAADGPCEMLRRPEAGLVMVRGRMGGTGNAFNLGEMTMTRCVVRAASGRVGFGYVAGRDRRHAELAARLDAAMQDGAGNDADNGAGNGARERVLARLRAGLARLRAEREAEVRATRVDFFTLVRGGDANG